ncbi:hypothetical protein M514_24818 [Trichuris suis]|uniref:Leishmanolysin-like peptidase n=1 Tax=Trichuris suis TaxID=68888 RepID=A0A085N0H2_9BILA|nr:hypothetical protein M514_24818 [Trichuris suis]
MFKWNIRASTQTLLHEILHVLAFAAEHLPKLKTRTILGRKGLIQRTKSWKVNNVNHVEKKSNVIASRNVQRFVRSYFNCSDAEGAELENDGGFGTAGSHWEKRLFGPEVMTGVQSRKGVFSGLTAALLEDTGWYKVNQSTVEDLNWAEGLGCTFLMRSCREYIESKPAKPGAAYPYCNWQDYILAQTMKMNLRRCDRKHKSVVQCNFEHNNTLSAEFAYFSGMNAVLEDMTVIHGASVTGADKYTDHCPMWQDVFHGDKSSDVGDMVCDNSGNRPDSKRNIGLEIYGHDSICVEQEGIFVAMECLPPRIFNLVQTRFDTMYGAGCYQYKCENGRLWIRGAGNSDDVGTMQYKVCWAEGAKIRLIRYLKDGDGSPTALYRGTLICPSCKEICEKNGFICEPDMQGINARDYMPSPCGGCRHLSVKWLIPAYVVGNLLLKLFH